MKKEKGERIFQMLEYDYRLTVQKIILFSEMLSALKDKEALIFGVKWKNVRGKKWEKRQSDYRNDRQKMFLETKEIN